MADYWAPIGRGDAAAIGGRARHLEDRGYAGAIGNQVYGPPWAPMAVAAANTTSLGLETGIAMAFVRSPFETACAALELDQISNGRFTLGLGTAPKAWTEGFFGQDFAPPLGRLREVIEVIRLVNDAAIEHVDTLPDYNGEHFQLEPSGPRSSASRNTLTRSASNRHSGASNPTTPQIKRRSSRRFCSAGEIGRPMSFDSDDVGHDIESFTRSIANVVTRERV